MNKHSAALHMQAKILANAMYGFSTLTTPKVKCFRSKTARKMAKYALKYDSLTPKQKKRLLSYEPWSNRRIHFHS